MPETVHRIVSKLNLSKIFKNEMKPFTPESYSADNALEKAKESMRKFRQREGEKMHKA